jgi:tRNA 2-thiocytidine biosynthesis protein TtcA
VTVVQQKFLDAVRDYRMVDPDDRIVLAVSGGKDSFTLLDLFCKLKQEHFPQVRFLACTISTDVTCSGSIPLRVLKELAASAGVEYETIYYPISEEAKGRVECFYCALRRRTALMKLAFQKGFTTIAFGHHQDDIVETLLMNVFHYGNVSTMAPKIRFFEGKIKIIRPLAYITEDETRAYAEEMTVVPPACQCGGLARSVRHDTKQFIAKLKQRYPDTAANLYKVLTTSGRGTE